MNGAKSLHETDTDVLASRLRLMRMLAGASWTVGYVDTEAARIIEELNSRRTPMALAALRAHAAPLGWCEDE